jgi:hypothetical protein
MKRILHEFFRSTTSSKPYDISFGVLQLHIAKQGKVPGFNVYRLADPSTVLTARTICCTLPSFGLSAKTSDSLTTSLYWIAYFPRKSTKTKRDYYIYM